jgi:diadenosine tetraphosphate (Ap4A) HIT family hydrolase
LKFKGVGAVTSAFQFFMQTATSKLKQKPLAGAESLVKNGFDSSVRNKEKPFQSARSPLPHTYVHKRGAKSQIKTKRTRSQRARERLQTKEHLTRLAVGLGEVELADKLDRCHSRLAVLTCGRHIARIIPNFTCEFRLCPDCGRRRSRKLQNKYLPMMRGFMLRHKVTPVHLVLTQTHRVETRKQSVKRLKDAFTKLQRREFWKKHFKGGTWSLEFTKDQNGLHHAHFHIIGFRRKFFDISLLRDEWFAVTGDSHVLHLKPVLDIATGLQEVVKYVSKPLDIRRFGADDMKEFLGLKNMRCFGTFGEFRDFCKDFEPSDSGAAVGELESLVRDLVEGCACPHPQCDEPLFELRMSKNELPQFYEQVEMSKNVLKSP